MTNKRSALGARTRSALNSFTSENNDQTGNLALADSDLDELRMYYFNGLYFQEVGTASSLPASALYHITTLTKSRILLTESQNDQQEVWNYDFSVDPTVWNQYDEQSGITATDGGAVASLSNLRMVIHATDTDNLRMYEFYGAVVGWVQVGNSFSLVANGAAVVAGLSLERTAIIYRDAGTDIYLAAYDFDGTDFSLVGSALSLVLSGDANVYGITALSGSRIAVTYDYGSSNSVLQSYDFNGSTWSTVGSALSLSSEASAYRPQVTAVSATVVIVANPQDKTLQAYTFNGSAWSKTGRAYTLSAMSWIAITYMNYHAWTQEQVLISSISDSDTYTGDTITVTGSGFTANTVVKFGDVKATDVTYNSDYSLSVVVPYQPVGSLVDVSVSDKGYTDTLVDEFTYIVEPVAITVTSVTPNTGTSAGGTAVTIAGTGFTVNCVVSFAAPFPPASATSVVFVSDTEITCVTPANAANPANVTVQDTVTLQSDTLVGGFTYT